MKSMGKPPYKDATPPRMPRTVGKGKSGNSFSIPNKATYGLGEGTQPTRMGRTVGKGAKGSGFSVSGGPMKSSRKDTGANTASGGQKYGVGGVSCSCPETYGGS